MRYATRPTRPLAALFVGIAIALASGNTAPALKGPKISTTPQFKHTPDTLICAFRGYEPGLVDPVLPIGGVYQSRWLDGDHWARKLPKGATLGVFSLTRGRVGSLRITGWSRNFNVPWKASSVFRGRWGLEAKGDVGTLMSTGIPDTATFWSPALAVWQRGLGSPWWAKARILDRGDETYKRIAREYLISRGLEGYLVSHGLSKRIVSRTKVAQVLSVDLGGDRKDELLISAYWSELDLPAVTVGTAGVGSWRCLLLVQMGAGGKQAITTISCQKHWFSTDWEEVLGCVDVDGDKRAEIVTLYIAGNPDEFRVYKWRPVRKTLEYNFLYGE